MRSMAASGPRLQRLRLPFSFDIHVWAHSDSIRLLQSPEVSSAHVISLGEVVLGRLSMLSSDGDAHRRRRTASDRPFTPRGLNQSGISAVIGEVVSAGAERLVQRDEVLLLAETQVLALEIIFRVMGVPQDELAEWAQAYTTMLKSVLARAGRSPAFPTTGLARRAAGLTRACWPSSSGRASHRRPRALWPSSCADGTNRARP